MHLSGRMLAVVQLLRVHILSQLHAQSAALTDKTVSDSLSGRLSWGIHV